MRFNRCLPAALLLAVVSACGGGGGTTTSAAAVNPAPGVSAAPWIPAASNTFQWQLSGTLDRTIAADIYDVDAFETTAATVAALHSAGRHAVCYVNAGAYEGGRPDAAAFPKAVIGAPYAGYPNESWLDIRRMDVLAPIMDARLDLCKNKAFDAVEPDNINGWENKTGFALQAQDQIAYNTWFAQHAHARGMSIALKNDDQQAAQLAPVFDFVIAEDCWNQSLCQSYAPFVRAHQAVFTVEYTDLTASAAFHQSVCPRASSANMTAILKNRNLDASRETCP